MKQIWSSSWIAQILQYFAFSFSGKLALAQKQLMIEFKAHHFASTLTLIPPKIIFVLKNFVRLFLHCIYSCIPQLHFYHGPKQYKPWSDCSKGSSLIWVYIDLHYRRPKYLNTRERRQQLLWMAGKELMVPSLLLYQTINAINLSDLLVKSWCHYKYVALLICCLMSWI